MPYDNTNHFASAPSQTAGFLGSFVIAPGFADLLRTPFTTDVSFVTMVRDPMGTGQFNIPGGQDYTYAQLSAGGTLTLTVNYDPATSVPEPLSAALLGTGLLGALARRRRAKA